MLFLAEFYLPGGTPLDSVAARARAGAERAASDGAQVSFVTAIFVPQDESCYALYRAAAAAEVTAAGSLAGLAFDRVTAAVVSDGMPPTAVRRRTS
jgi:hypothetical protein